MIFIGLDPGVSGGIAAITDSDGVIVLTWKMPETDRDIIDVLRSLAAPGCKAVIEHVWSIPGQGGAFKFGKSVGALLMALTAAGIPFDQVLPRTWQKALGVVYPKGAGDTEKKNITKRRAQQIFPTLTITHAIADALLMAEYCRRLERGSIRNPVGVTHGKDEEVRKGKSYRTATEEHRLKTAIRAHAEEAWDDLKAHGINPLDILAPRRPAQPAAPRHGRRAHPSAR